MPRTLSVRSALLAALIGATTLLAPLSVSAQESASYEGIPFANPSAVSDAAATPAASPEAGATPEAASTWHGAYLGNPDAPVTMQIYADYQCPHCRTFHRSVEQLLIENFVRPGKLRLEFIDFPVIGIRSQEELTDDSAESVQAAEATMCAGEQDAFLPYREALYEGDIEMNSGAFSDANLIATAEELNLDTDRFGTCLASGRYEHAVIVGRLDGAAKGVPGTPAMMIDGELLQPSTWEELQEMLNTAIEEAS